MPKLNKPPSFQFYVDDFASDGKVEAMTTKAVGAYILLLCKAWREDPPGSIPNSDAVLARWARVTPEEWADCRKMVLAAFTLGNDGRWHQQRMRREFQKLQSFKKQRVTSAQIAAKARWHNPNIDSSLDASRIRDASVTDASRTVFSLQSSSSPSFSSSSEEERERSDSLSLPDPPAEVAKKPKAKVKPKLSDEEWLDELQAREVYKQLPVRMLYAKMLSWCEVRGKQPTRGRFINWLNREDQPLNAPTKGVSHGKHSQPNGASVADRIECDSV